MGFYIPYLILCAVGILHLLWYQRDYKTSAYWLLMIVLAPPLGVILYFLFGNHFVQRRALRYQQKRFRKHGLYQRHTALNPSDSPDHPSELTTLIQKIAKEPITSATYLKPLFNGDQAMPAMIEAIQHAKQSVYLCSYIFEPKGIGMTLIQALEAAVKRGVRVRVLIDSIGIHYSWPPVQWELHKRQIPFNAYMPLHWLARLLTLNLRNHRKLLIVDDTQAFTGGMNIRQGNMLHKSPPHPIQDLHLQIQGPAVHSLFEVFAEDWFYCTGEKLPLSHASHLHFHSSSPVVILPDGPDEKDKRMLMSFLAYLQAAKSKITLFTPYFLPPQAIIDQLKLASLRGVTVTIHVPQKNNIPLIKYASQTLFHELKQTGCHIKLTLPPFDHSKLFIIDDTHLIIGSSNWDNRSLRLNYELNLSIQSHELIQQMLPILKHKSKLASLWVHSPIRWHQRLLQGLARIFIPAL
jgi:cardiolipin synthase